MKKNISIKNSAIVLILFLASSFTFGQKKLSYDKRVQEIAIKKINSNLKIKGQLSKTFGSNSQAFVKTISTYAALSREDQGRMDKIIVTGMIESKQISASEGKIISSLISDNKVDKQFLMDIRKKEFSTETAKVLIPKLVDIRLENPNGGVQAQGSKGKLIGAILGGIAGWFAGGGTPAGVGPGVAIGSVAGDIIEDEYNKYTSGGASITPAKQGCFEEYPINTRPSDFDY